MKKVWISIIAVATAVAMVSSAFAQGAGPKTGAPGQGVAPGQKGQQGRPGGMRRGKMQQEILAKLNLTPAQKNKITALQEGFKKKMEGMRPKDGKGAAPDPAQREKFMAMYKAHNDSIMAVFTPAQKAQYEKLMAEMRAKRGQNGGPGKPGGKPPTGAKPPAGKPGKGGG